MQQPDLSDKDLASRLVLQSPHAKSRNLTTGLGVFLATPKWLRARSTKRWPLPHRKASTTSSRLSISTSLDNAARLLLAMTSRSIAPVSKRLDGMRSKWMATALNPSMMLLRQRFLIRVARLQSSRRPKRVAASHSCLASPAGMARLCRHPMQRRHSLSSETWKVLSSSLSFRSMNLHNRL